MTGHTVREPSHDPGLDIDPDVLADLDALADHALLSTADAVTIPVPVFLLLLANYAATRPAYPQEIHL